MTRKRKENPHTAKDSRGIGGGVGNQPTYIDDDSLKKETMISPISDSFVAENTNETFFPSTSSGPFVLESYFIRYISNSSSNKETEQ